MMKCQKIRQYLLADYSDGEVEEEINIEIGHHLKGCEECYSFSISVKELVLDPFENMPLMPLPQQVWTNIEKRIEDTQTAEKNLENVTSPQILMHLNSLFLFIFSKRLIGIAFVIIFVLFSVKFLNKEVKNQINISGELYKEEMEYVISSSLLEEEAQVNFGTKIEKYFL